MHKIIMHKREFTEVQIETCVELMNEVAKLHQFLAFTGMLDSFHQKFIKTSIILGTYVLGQEKIDELAKQEQDD